MQSATRDARIHQFQFGMAWIAMTTMAGCLNPAARSSEERRAKWAEADKDAGPVTMAADFDNARADQAPPSPWRAAAVHVDPSELTWRVIKDTFAASRPNVLALTQAGSIRKACNFCVYDGPTWRDLEFSGRVNGDEGAGLAFRMVDDQNTYIARVNPGEGNVRFYKLVDGDRRRIAEARLTFRDEDGWYGMRVRAVGNQLDCRLTGEDADGKTHAIDLSVRDDAFSEAGRIAVWTRANVRGRFDNLLVRSLDAPEDRE